MTIFETVKPKSQTKPKPISLKKQGKSLFDKATRENYMYNGSFQEAVGPILALAQCFGVMPVIGITSKSVNDLKFHWNSFRVFYSVLVIIGLATMDFLTVFWTLMHRLEFAKFVLIIFYSSNLYAAIYFFYLGRKWPTLMQDWDKVEQKLPVLRTQFEKRALAFEIKNLSIFIISLSLIEHLLSVITLTHTANNCDAIKDPIEAFFMVSLTQLFYVTEYSPFKSFVGKICSVLATFIWSFTDLFVILVSLGLSSRFKIINDFMAQHKEKAMSEKFWGKQRRNYTDWCGLLDKVDNAIGQITLLSFSNNLFFITTQLMNSINEMPSIISAVYFWFSMLYLIVRTLAVSIYSAEINEESKRPFETFRCISKESWCLEVKRFSEEVCSDFTALSGLKFFYITRNLVLNVAAIIITYDLILIQFHQTHSITDVDPCYSNSTNGSSYGQTQIIL